MHFSALEPVWSLSEQSLRQINYTDTCRGYISNFTAWRCIDTKHSQTQEIPAK